MTIAHMILMSTNQLTMMMIIQIIPPITQPSRRDFVLAKIALSRTTIVYKK